MSITVDFGWRTGRVIVGVILIIAGLAALVGSFMGIFGAVWGTGLTYLEGGVGAVVALVGLLIIFGARKQMKGQAQEVDVKFVPKK